MWNKTVKQQLLGNIDRGIVFVLSAPAGTGKTTLVKRLSQEFDVVELSVSYTTRPKRPNERDGVDYHFVDDRAFEKKEKEGEFIESVTLFGYRYGTSKKKIEEAISKGKHIFLVIDTQGALLLQKKIDAVFIFIQPPSLEELKKRLLTRGTESSDVINARLKQAKEEMKLVSRYDYLIINDDLDIAYEVLKSILVAEEHRLKKGKIS
jgi:guanylate kinase